VSRAFLNETTNQKPDYLFVYAPESFGWKELLLKGSPIEVRERQEVDKETGRTLVTYPYTDPDRAKQYKDSYQGWNRVGAGMVTFWLVLVFLLMLGFSYSFFWSAMTMIYLLMRRKVDEVELDEVYLEEETPDAPLGPPAGAAPTMSGPGVASLPMVPPPPAPLPPPAAVNFTGPVGALGTPPSSTVPPATPPAPATTSTTESGKSAGGPEKADGEASRDGETK
jgi:hypothetical protein